MIVQISQRGKECLKAARTLLRGAQTMTDRAIAGQLGAQADNHQRRAEKASHVDAAKALVRSAASAERDARGVSRRNGVSGREHQADANLLSAFALTIGGALGAGLRMALLIIWLCS
jgi:hypothetical protein